eukprot:gene8631-11664_t
MDLHSTNNSLQFDHILLSPDGDGDSDQIFMMPADTYFAHSPIPLNSINSVNDPTSYLLGFKNVSVPNPKRSANSFISSEDNALLFADQLSYYDEQKMKSLSSLLSDYSSNPSGNNINNDSNSLGLFGSARASPDNIFSPNANSHTSLLPGSVNHNENTNFLTKDQKFQLDLNFPANNSIAEDRLSSSKIADSIFNRLANNNVPTFLQRSHTSVGNLDLYNNNDSLGFGILSNPDYFNEKSFTNDFTRGNDKLGMPRPSSTPIFPVGFNMVTNKTDSLRLHQTSFGDIQKTISPPINSFSQYDSTLSISLDKKQVGTGNGQMEDSFIIKCCFDILSDASEKSLKAVELANTLRARVGTDALAHIRERYGGLLTLLEKFRSTFRVDRIPKNDKVTLISNKLSLNEGHFSPQDAYNRSVASHQTQTGSRQKPVLSSIVPVNPIISRPSSSLSQTHSPTLESSIRLNSNNYHFYEDSNNGGILNDIKYESNFQSGQQPTRCLHVGNVPQNLTEISLRTEFEKFGPIEGLKIVTQKTSNRRFAFITFQTIEHAVKAKHHMSKVHPWKSAISFAHKEFTSSPSNNRHQNSRNNNNNNINQSSNFAVHSSIESMHQPNFLVNPLMYAMDPQPLLPQGHISNDIKNTRSVLGDVPLDLNYMGLKPSDGYYNHLNIDQLPNNGNWPTIDNLLSSLQDTTLTHSNENNHYVRTPANNGTNCPVLRRLCDDTYVPTQPWPIDEPADRVYYTAVIAQLQQFGGSTTISKLRGFLRNRVAATDNIKSVPLKAMLAAYPHLFVVQSNYVSLIN